MEEIKIKRQRQQKSPLEQIYSPKLNKPIEEFYHALEEFMEDCPDVEN